jgi:hypothetical protein
MSINFSLENLKRVYVSSCRRGFLAISDQPMCVTEASGGSGNSTIIAVKRVYREGGKWVYENRPSRPVVAEERLEGGGGPHGRPAVARL